MESDRQRKRQRLPLPTEERRAQPDVVDLSSGSDEPVIAKMPSRKDISEALQNIDVSSSKKEPIRVVKRIQKLAHGLTSSKI